MQPAAITEPGNGQIHHDRDIPPAAVARRTARSSSAVVMSISAGASSTGTPPIILQRYLISDTCAHLPRRTEALSGKPGTSERGACGHHPRIQRDHGERHRGERLRPALTRAEPVAGHDGPRGPTINGLPLVLVARPVLALAGVPLRGVDGTVDLLVVLMVGVVLGEPRYFVDSLVGLLRVLLGVGLRLLL